MSQSLHPMLNIAIKAARAAGAIINRGSQDLDILKVTHKGPNDFVSEIDQMAEAAIIDTLLTAYPGHGILAEESGREHGAQNSEFVWIIDPLDGTTNFLHGLPMYSVSIALAWRGVVQQAVVYDPTRNDLFYASRGRGAFLNDKRLRVSKRTRLADSLIGTGFPYRRGDNLQRYLKMLETVMQACAGVRRPGSAALDLCYVAAGWYDGFFESGLNPWDIAAGSLIITEAGGLVGNFTGNADFMYQREVVAANPKVYGQLVTLLAPYSRAIKGDEAGDGAEASATAPASAPAGAPATAGLPSDAVEAALAASAAAALADGQPGRGPLAAASATASATTASAATVLAGAPASEAAPAERERKPVRIRKVDSPPAEPLAGDRQPGPRGPRQDANDRPRGPRPDVADSPYHPRREPGTDRPRPTGKPAPGRPLPNKRGAPESLLFMPAQAALGHPGACTSPRWTASGQGSA